MKMLEFGHFPQVKEFVNKMQHLPALLPNFNQARILVIGDCMLDRYWFGDTSRISPEAPVPIVKINNSDHRPGGAGNVALNIASLGAQVILLGIVGKDEAAERLQHHLHAAEVKTDLCIDAHIETVIKLRVISKHQQLIRLDFEEKFICTSHEDLIEKFIHHLPQVDLCVLSDYHKGTLADPQAFITRARQANVPVIVDPKNTDFAPYRGASVITPNFKEFQAVVGKVNNEQELARKGQDLLKQFELSNLLITRGEDGMTLVTPTETQHLPAYAREVFDVTGAGDTVVATLSACLAAKCDFLAAMALANVAASLVVGKLGAATVSTPELQVAISGKTNFACGIVNEEQLFSAVREARTQGKKIVFTNGCFDILHAGHVTSLRMAKQLGDYLIVAVNTDESIQKLKGHNRPINNLEHRMTVLAGLGMVDWVVPFADDTPERLLRLLKPDLLAKGADYRIDQVVGAEIVRSYGGEVRIMNHNIRTSSTSILNRMHEVVE
jgi:D-beta-D-heptose 7-phosphate kinase/D-beta-D-heptose 1-phosphate adenosyltransferase